MGYRRFIVLVMLLVLPVSLVASEEAADYKFQSPSNKYPFKRIDHLGPLAANNKNMLQPVPYHIPE